MNLIHQQGTMLSGHEFTELFNKALSQTEKIMLWYHERSGEYTAEEIQKNVLPGTLLTSVRRSMTDLSNSGYLVKGTKVMGSYGVHIYTYKRA